MLFFSIHKDDTTTDETFLSDVYDIGKERRKFVVVPLQFPGDNIYF